MTGLALDPADMARRVQAFVQKPHLRRIAPCCDDPPHHGPCNALTHRYRATRAATPAEVRVAGHRGQGGLVQLVKRSMEADLDEDLEVKP